MANTPKERIDTERLLKADEYPGEMKRVKEIIEKTDSPYLKRDMTKYLRRLEREYAEYMEWTKNA